MSSTSADPAAGAQESPPASGAQEHRPSLSERLEEVNRLSDLDRRMKGLGQQH
ncbi:hypothetical protein SAMN06297387_11161 [Streptomyces zhaozhouensis]|uniref:Uncharacterized protein n=1 Tax=Streptomyces zhaozhouensis TaxID=1300267 RepID=A0A286DY84_9ACTN|nr:hypothetical protein [Streptomyces zhaozhouensis]SOD63514.1 hypothetical protein SAMN06297387_11161 [Streptomyces zhaozhouensis]